MKLLTEYIDFNRVEVFREDVEVNGKKSKNYYLKGPMLEAETKNKNGRRYMNKTLVREVQNFYVNKIQKHRSLGELDHPPDPTVNLENVSHMITNLEMRDNIGYGVARLLDTPMGKIAKTLVDEGVSLGMSTRGVGTLDGDLVKDDYKLITIDIVADPSAPSAFVEGVLENKEYIVKGDEIVEAAVNNLQKKVYEKYSKYDHKDMSKHVLGYLNDFISEIRSKSN